MKKKMFLSKVFSKAFLFSALAVIFVGAAFAQANRPNPTGDGTNTPAAAAGYVSGLFSLLPGQTVRVAAVNAGRNAIPIEFLFIPVSAQGKTATAIPRFGGGVRLPGDAGIEKYTFIPDGTSTRQLMYVQIRVQNATDLKDIVPSLEIYNEQGGPGPHYFVSGSGFIEIRPIWVPS